MKKEVKEKWVAALKSGKYRQGKGALCNGDTFCCLGVLCDLYHNETGLGHWSNMSFSTNRGTGSMFPPPPVVEWAELEDPDPIVKGERLSVYNDGRFNSICEGQVDIQQQPFDKIAELIENNL